MSTNNKRNFVMKSRLCFNCLNFGHQVSSCYFPSCPRCWEKHNSKLHEEQAKTSIQDTSIANDDDRPEPHATAMYTEILAPETENLNVLLATAIVNVCDTFGRMHSCRAVLYSGSQLNFITNSCAKRLNLSTASHTLDIVGVFAMVSTAKQPQDTIMTSRFGDFKTNIKIIYNDLLCKTASGEPRFSSILYPKYIYCQRGQSLVHSKVMKILSCNDHVFGPCRYSPRY